MKLSIASVVFLVLASVMLAVRGASDWSPAFGFTWYGVFGVAVILAVGAVGVAVAGRGLSGRRRSAIILLALPALVAVPLAIEVILTLAPLAN